MSQAPPPLAPTGEDAIYQTIDVEPEAFADVEEAGSLAEAYEVDLTLQEIEKGGYQRVSDTSL
jgi:diphthamide biosynthesis protein 2